MYCVAQTWAHFTKYSHKLHQFFSSFNNDNVDNDYDNDNDNDDDNENNYNNV